MVGGGSGGHVFRTTDGGRTWADVSGGLPNFAAYSMVIDPRALPGFPNGKLYVGTQVGVYVSTDNAASWSRLGNGLPNVPVRDLQISQDYQEIVAGTLGRGAFEISIQVEGPRVVGVTPTTPTSPGLSSLIVAFDHPVDPRTFTPGNIQSLTGPLGPITVMAVKDTDTLNHQTFQIVFAPQASMGFIASPSCLPFRISSATRWIRTATLSTERTRVTPSAPILWSTVRTTAASSPAFTMTC
jgi:hypothetical protein